MAFGFWPDRVWLAALETVFFCTLLFADSDNPDPHCSWSIAHLIFTALLQRLHLQIGRWDGWDLLPSLWNLVLYSALFDRRLLWDSFEVASMLACFFCSCSHVPKMKLKMSVEGHSSSHEVTCVENQLNGHYIQTLCPVPLWNSNSEQPMDGIFRNIMESKVIERFYFLILHLFIGGFRCVL